ncbi:MAG: GNAT family N-acetyltransferase [Ferruginibacter sp.]
MTVQYLVASADDEYAAAAILFKEYAASININLDFQHFDKEITTLKEMYAPSEGGIILAKSGEEIIGCAAIRKLGEQEAELKRMYVKPGQQSLGIGRNLLIAALDLASKCNYKVVKLDTLNHMLAAIHLYKQYGFYEVPAYYQNPIATALYFEKKL